MEQQKNAPPQVRNVIKFLRSTKSELKARVGVLNGKRIDYFKGKGALKALQSPAYAKLSSVPPQPKSDEEAIKLLHSFLPYGFFLLVDRGPPSGTSSSSPKHLTIVQMQAIRADGYYAWLYEGPQWTTYLGGIGMVAIMLAGVMFPLWPPILRLGVWYLSMGVLGLIGLFFAIAIVRLIFYIITILAAPPGIWIFPKLFADVGFVESFIPGWDWDLPPKKKTRKSKKGATESAEGSGAESSSKKSKLEPRPKATGGATIEEVADEGDD